MYKIPGSSSEPPVAAAATEISLPAKLVEASTSVPAAPLVAPV